MEKTRKVRCPHHSLWFPQKENWWMVFRHFLERTSYITSPSLPFCFIIQYCKVPIRNGRKLLPGRLICNRQGSTILVPAVSLWILTAEGRALTFHLESAKYWARAGALEVLSGFQTLEIERWDNFLYKNAPGRQGSESLWQRENNTLYPMAEKQTQLGVVSPPKSREEK